MAIAIFIGTCDAAEVLDWKQTNNDDNGRYFYLTTADFEKMVGSEVLDEYIVDVIQVGSQHWAGKIVAWKGEGGSDVCGKRISGSAKGQWVAGDKMVLQTCNGKNQLFLNMY